MRGVGYVLFRGERLEELLRRWIVSVKVKHGVGDSKILIREKADNYGQGGLFLQC
jgi:hypothetical protein